MPSADERVRGGQATRSPVRGDAKTPPPLFIQMGSLSSGLTGRQSHSHGREFLPETRRYMIFILSFSYIQGLNSFCRLVQEPNHM